ncbi:MAG: hypothetical protein K2O79_08320, partial [Muribaculaceae bacterium]|nr:hypothetical protein [Muribaculaceae bacterium]
ELIYCPEKPDPLENAFSMEKTFRDLDWRPQYSYLDQLRDFKHEMETDPMAGLWGVRADYEPNDEAADDEDYSPARGRVSR